VPGAVAGGGGNTLVSIPIPVSVPMPLSQSGGGGQAGPIVITSPPPPAPPNPPIPPYPPTPRPGIAQDVASMLMMLLMNHVRERIDGTSPEIKSQQQIRDEQVAAAAANAAVEAVNKAQLPKEPMVPAWMFRELLPAAGRRPSVDSDKHKKKKKAKKKRDLPDYGPLETPAPVETPPPPPAPPLVLPFSVQDAATEIPPSVQVQKIPDLAESPESPEESPEE
ncbi:cyclin-dependent kinase 12-like, partial [Rhipicephalus sanguineus]|uniref:cyclin-dependent kinase 12-like n=1 Tax=Rhipicephalus sanguineus TaxID=34632 RepID=UPI001895A1AA